MEIRGSLIGLGCMRLSELEEREAIAVLHAALEAGVTWLDTADVYARDVRDVHGNERLIARALGTWTRARPSVVTKAGLVRTTGKWTNDGRGAHLRAACDASREALGVDALDVLLLHAPDPRTPIETSVRALASLREAGLVRAIGVSNVALGELDRARAIATIDVVEIALSPGSDTMLRSGVIERCAAHGIRLLAHTPLGGPKRAPKLASDPTLASIAAKHGASAAAVVLAWLRDLSPVIVPIPGVRSASHAREVARAITLDDDDRARLDARWPAGVRVRVPLERRRPAMREGREVVVLMGIQGAGKTTIARESEAGGAIRLNRDELGGTLRGLVPRLEIALASGATRVVLDNTYATRASRAEVIDAAWKHGVPVRCVWLDTPIEVAQANVVRRVIAAHGRLLGPSELLAESKKDEGVLPPLALLRYRRQLEAPSGDEGFSSVQIVPFERRAPRERGRAGHLVAADALADDRVVAALRAVARDVVVHAYAWAPGERERARAVHAVEAARRALDREIPLGVCSHPAGPPICWCRPPLPGLAVHAVMHDGLDPASTEVISTRAADRAIADGIGARFLHV